MSTNNFSFENILVVLPDFNFYHDCESGNSCDGSKDCDKKGECEGFDDFAYDEYVKDMQDKLEKIGFESCDKWDNDRNYGGKIIAEWGQEDNCFIKYLQVVIKSGYYSGANIDWTVDGDFCPDEESKKEVAHVVVLQKRFDKQVEKLEKILRKNGTELLKVAQFSNGEAVYKKK